MTAARPRVACIPRATYRLQLHQGFDFDAARGLLPYLDRLGVSHVYCSPIGMAAPGSLHGYDVIDPTQINPELGGRAGFERLSSAARELGMGLLIDQVPNHMGIGGSHNPWWSDVLQHGQASAYAHFFDIDWHPGNPALEDKVMMPVLGAPCGEVIDAGEIVLAFDADKGGFALTYHAHRFALDPASYGRVLREQSDVRLAGFAARFEALPAHSTAEEAERTRRRDEARRLQLELSTAVAQDASLGAAIEACVAALNAPDARDRLDALHEAQAFRLAYYRSAIDDINYRRFFDINELAALRIEDERVFEATQGLALDLAAEGWVDGLRIDHPDGLLDPRDYFDRLQAGYARRCGFDAATAAARPLYVVGEKIEALHEELPTDWAVHGTTGYRFMTLGGGISVERRHAARMDRIWRAATGLADDCVKMVHDAKRRIARDALSALLSDVARTLREYALADRHTRDHGAIRLRHAVAEVAAALPVYRTYVDREGRLSEQDRRYIDWAVDLAIKDLPRSEVGLYEFVRQALQARAPDGMDERGVALLRRFATRFQQYSAPVAARGVEDTAFYRYYRLASLNEVGGDPAVFGISADEFHAANRERAATWPHTMLATSTHDNKRAEDVRGRIDVLAERPAAWKLAVRRFEAATRDWCVSIKGEPAPSAAERFLLLQSVLGTLPVEGLSAQGLPVYRERIENYMLKAAREAKVHTTWADAGVEYEAALRDFVQRLLQGPDGNPVLERLQAEVPVLAWYGALNGLALTLLKHTVPGVPDTYQGTELVDLSLVDPDNRRPVDFGLRRRWLEELHGATESGDRAALCARLAETLGDGRLKLWLTWQLLQVRRRHPAFFAGADYLPLKVGGERRRHALAFLRRQGDSGLIVVCGRKFAGLPAAPGTLPLGPEAWGDTWIEAPEAGGAPGVEFLGGARIAAADGRLRLADLLRTLPFAVVGTGSLGE